MKNTPKIHPACAMMPPLPPKAFADLRASIKRVGLVQPILTTTDGSIIDGKNRLHACELEHVTPVFAPASMNGMDPVVWVLEVNRHRLRTSSQLALAAARLVTATVGGDRQSAEIKSAICGRFLADVTMVTNPEFATIRAEREALRCRDDAPHKRPTG